MQWLNFFLDDDAKLATIGADYAAGRMLSGEIKARTRGPPVLLAAPSHASAVLQAELVTVLSDLVGAHQARRAAVTDADVAAFMSTAPRAAADLFG